MKVKLLKKIKSRGYSQVNIYSVTRTGGTVTGMRYGFNEDCYSGLFGYGDTEQDVKRKACHIYWEQTRDMYRKKYKKEDTK